MRPTSPPGRSTTRSGSSSGTTLIEEIGRYRIDKLLGEGAMAEVYKAYDPEIHRTLAIKVLKREQSLNDQYVSRFLREAKAAGGFSHPNIVTVYDVGQVKDRPFIVMELVEGTPLDEALRASAPLPINAALSIGVQLANALDYAHSRGVVHRDIKPSNILMLPDQRTIKIADFGIAHMEDPSKTQQTQVGTVLGTPQYMSPEQVMGLKADARSDLFSVGVILYQLFTGQKPFNGDTIATLVFQITREEPPPISEIAPHVPAGLRHIVTKLLSKDPTKRFQSGAELERALSYELQALEQRAQEKEQPRYIPIRVKWTLLMIGLVALTMAVSLYFIQAKQSDTLTHFAIDSGASLAKFMASETAVPVLSEDWVTIEIFVDEAANRQSFEYIVVLDHQGTVRGATDHALIGQSYEGPPSLELLLDSDAVRTTVVESAGGTEVLNFNTPILFQGKEVGRINLGLAKAPLQDVLDTTLYLLIGLAAVTILAVGIVSYILAQLLSGPLRALRNSIQEVARGNLDCRLDEDRNDELGEIFSEFNKMAASLEPKHDDEKTRIAL